MRSVQNGWLWPSAARLTLGLTAGLLLAGCQRDEVRVYRVPKEKTGRAAASAPSTRSHLSWKTPAGWTEQPGGNVRLVRFEVQGQNGQKADVAVLPLVGTAIAHGQVVNMVREQLELGPLAEEELARLAQKVRIGPAEGELVEMISTNALIDGRFTTRVLMAAARHQDTLWLFKMSGPDELVAGQRGAFLEFLKSVQFQPDISAEAMDASGNASTTTDRKEGSGSAAALPALPQWEVPSDWQAQPPGPLVLARYSISEPAGRAEVTVSALPGDSGGLVANVNRWRGQIGLGPVQPGEAAKLVERFDAASGQVSLVDMTGTDGATGRPTRLIGAMLARGGRTWFFKLRGDQTVVERQRPAFLKFIQSARVPDA